MHCLYLLRNKYKLEVSLSSVLFEKLEAVLVRFILIKKYIIQKKKEKTLTICKV